MIDFDKKLEVQKLKNEEWNGIIHIRNKYKLPKTLQKKAADENEYTHQNKCM